jgi:cephalosporin hydroxylase
MRIDVQLQSLVRGLSSAVGNALHRSRPKSSKRGARKDGRAKSIRELILHPDYVGPYLQTVAEWMQYQQSEIVFDKVSWMGQKTVHNVLDLWVYQEIIAERKPEVIIEIGSLHGGTTLFLAHLFDLIGAGQVLSIEIKRPPDFPVHPRITYLDGSSGDQAIIQRVTQMASGKRTMIIHDGDHHRDSVLRDLRGYAGLVSVGQYFVVCDGVADVFSEKLRLGKKYPGPLQAVDQFLTEARGFRIDLGREKYKITHNQHGFLERVS